MSYEPLTLGDKLASLEPGNLRSNFGKRLRNALYTALDLSLLTVISAVPMWWFFMHPDIDRNTILVVWLALIALWYLVYRGHHAAKSHYLLANDRQGFMRDLRLDAKTAVFDGSNIYHFGRANGLDAQPLGEIAHQLRDQGYRIVCFFDANIFYTLDEHGAFLSTQRHSPALLEDIFGLRKDEIYVVPSGVQADKYILESLRQLPISFAVTNDRFRDYTNKYATVMRDNHWRKGVVISKGEIKLLHHRLQKPIKLK